jgi:hypothetical protein
MIATNKVEKVMIKRTKMTMLLLLLALLRPAFAFDQQHQAFTAVLSQYVHWDAAGSATSVDYASLKAHQAALNTYTQSLSQVSEKEFASFSKLERRAFLINAYNAFTLQLILSKYPDLTSIKDLGSLLRSPWKKGFIALLGKTVSLDEIEQQMLRGAPDYDDPRIHFAVNCASIGCPALRPQAYVALSLDAQLLDQTQRFLRDKTRNRFNRAEQTLEISSIFKWYGDDFGKGYLSAHSLAEFLANFAGSLGLNSSEAARLKAGEIEIDFLSYDWSLNRLR